MKSRYTVFSFDLDDQFASSSFGVNRSCNLWGRIGRGAPEKGICEHSRALVSRCIWVNLSQSLVPWTGWRTLNRVEKGMARAIDFRIAPNAHYLFGCLFLRKITIFPGKNLTVQGDVEEYNAWLEFCRKHSTWVLQYKSKVSAHSKKEEKKKKRTEYKYVIILWLLQRMS